MRLATPSLRRAIRDLPVTRDLPWRRTRDPWQILIAELCCQQTQADRAADAFERLRTRFPTPAACAAAPFADVLEAWRGLGYYRRARALHEAATQLVARHGGQVPDDLAALLALRGVGPYTARAILAFAFEHDVAVVDTNAAKVLARAVAGRRLTARESQALADSIVPEGRGWAHNQAMLDLGATHCRSVPRCDGCPLRGVCRWRRGGNPTDPAASTAHTSRRPAPFRGSDREGRGLLLAAALDGPVPRASLGVVAGWPRDTVRVDRVVAQLVADGLVVVDGRSMRVAGR